MTTETNIFPIDKLRDRNSKSNCIQLFKIAKSSFYEILNACIWLEDFENDYPSCDNQVIREANLSKYQAWVIFTINQYRVNLGVPLKKLSQLLSNESQLNQQLSKENFINEFTTNSIQA